MKKLITLLLVISVLASAFCVMPVSAAINGKTYTEDFTNGDGVGFDDDTAFTVTGGAAVLNNEVTGKWMFLPKRETKFDAIQAADFEDSGKMIEYGYDVFVSYEANRTFEKTDKAFVKGHLEIAKGDGNTIQTVSAAPEVLLNCYKSAGANNVTFQTKTTTDNGIVDATVWGAASLGIPNRTYDTVNEGGETYKIKAVVRYVPANGSTSAYYETRNYVNGQLMTYNYSPSSSENGKTAYGRIAALDNTTLAGRRMILRLNIGDNGSTEDNIKIDNAYIKMYEPKSFEQNFTGVTTETLGSYATVASGGEIAIETVNGNSVAVVKNTANKSVTLPVPNGNTFNIDAYDFEDAGNYLEYGYRIYSPAYVNPIQNEQSHNMYGLLEFRDGNGAVYQTLSMSPKLCQGNGKMRFEYIAAGTTSGSQWGINSGDGVTDRNNVDLSGAGWHDVKVYVKYVKDGDTGYYDAYPFVDGKLLTKDDGTPAVYRNKERADMTDMVRSVTFTTYCYSKATNNAGDVTYPEDIMFDDVYIRLVDASKVDISNITIDATGNGSASIAYLNTTGAAKTSDSLILAAYNDNDVLVGAKVVSGQAIAKDGASKITAAFGAAVAGATKYRAFYWDSALKPMADAAGPVNVVTE